jgi:aminoglycoside 3-N-acetyltransferase
MDESDLIARSHRGPVTVEMLASDLAALGLKRGTTVIVHSSLSSLGWVCGGAQAVIIALRSAVGDHGTLVVPTGTGTSTPSEWTDPPVPRSWWETIEASVPDYDPRLSNPRGMGVIPDTLLRLPETRRSPHPYVSLAAWGPKAAEITSGHRLTYGLGEDSPLARVYDLDGSVLLLGVGYNRNTSLHLAEYRAEWPSKRRHPVRIPRRVGGERVWETVADIDTDSSDFPEIGADLEADTDVVRIGRVGHGTARLMSQRALVDYGAAWMAKNRG